eukprot:3862035-Rhodomonas_salina.1
MFRICGWTMTFIPSSIFATLNSYVINGISSFQPDVLRDEIPLIETIWETLVQTNPLASTCCLWGWRGFENFDITILGHEVGSQPQEIAVLLHRPNCNLQTREFDVLL